MKKKEMGFGEIFQKGKTAARRPKQGGAEGQSAKGAKGAGRTQRRGQEEQRGQTAQVERIAERIAEHIPEPITPKQPLNINIPADLHRRFKAQCTLDGTDMTTVIVRMIEGYMGGER